MGSAPAGDNADQPLPGPYVAPLFFSREVVLDFRYFGFLSNSANSVLCGNNSPLCPPPPLCPHPSRTNWPRISIACSIRADHE
jgi:hypothetical protein